MFPTRHAAPRSPERLDRYRQGHRQDADRVRDAIFNIFSSTELGFAAGHDADNPGIMLVHC